MKLPKDHNICANDRYTKTKYCHVHFIIHRSKLSESKFVAETNSRSSKNSGNLDEEIESHYTLTFNFLEKSIRR